MPSTTRPLSGAVAPLDEATDHQCGRCRMWFPAVDSIPQATWWLCPECHERLIGPR
jgi:hypothetical protein